MDRSPAGPGGSRVPKKNKRRRHSRRGKTRLLPDRPEGLARHLTEAAREALVEMFGPRNNVARPFPLEIKATILPGQPWRVEAEPCLEEQIRAAVREMAAQAEVYRYGRVYCYRCDSSLCTHAVPERPSCIFSGYSSTGMPRWSELSQILLELGHDNVDLLFKPMGREVVAAYMDAGFLKQRQLNIFGRQSKTYDILGQVVFGFVELVPPGSGPAKSERVALTLQAVESRRPDGSARLDLNVLAQFADGSPALDGLSTGGPRHHRIFNIILEARQRIGSLVPRGAGGKASFCLKPETICRAEETLRRMARSLEQAGRQTCRRTAHAEERSVDQRPTCKALEDAAAALDENVLWDTYRNTVVVVGPRSRVHVFSPEGRLVTSLLLDPEAVRNRLKRRRWQHLAGDVLAKFRARAGSNAKAASDPIRTENPQPEQARHVRQRRPAPPKKTPPDGFL